MRKLSFFLTFALVLTLAYGALAQTNIGVVAIDNVTNQYSPTQLRAGANHLVSLRYSFVGLDSPVGWAVGNTFEVYSPDGANWVNLLAADGPLTTPMSAAVSRYRKYYTSTNNGVNWVATVPGGGPQPGGSTGVNSRVAYSLATISFTGEGYAPGSSGIALTIQFQTLLADAGKQMCFDTTKASGAVAWEWASGSLADWPQWDNGLGAAAPRCWEIFEVPDLPPVWNADPAVGNVSFNHCGEGSFTLAATDPEGQPVTYEFAAGFETGFGTITGNVWTWSGPTVPQDAILDVEFVAKDVLDQPTAVNFVLHVTTTNRTPTIACPSMLTVSINTCKTQTVTPADLDVCDVLTVSVLDNGGAAGAVNVTGNVVEFCPVSGDELLAQPVSMVVQVSDGTATATCNLLWNVIAGAPYQVEIEKVEDQIQGQYTDVFIKLHKFDVTQGLGGFDFLVAYDASALSFQLAFEGEIYDECNWEYFTFRFGPDGNCGNACPSGMLRIIGLAETNNGSAHPGCGVNFVQDAPVILAEMRFLVSNDRTLECQYVPIRFFWFDCGDNILSNASGSEAYLSQKVFEYTTFGEPFLAGEITDRTTGFPTYTGHQTECYFEQGDKIAKENVDFQNGGIDIVCADSIDAPGDVNLNGIPYEIADAVMFTNYFVSGLGAFAPHIDGSVAATDTNKDGITLSVADLVYLIRVIVGDALPYDKISPVAARVTVDSHGIFSSTQALGAAYIVVAGDVTPTLLAPGMELKSAFDGQNTNVLVYSLEGNSCTGEFLQADGPVVSTEFAAFNGAPVVADVMPADFQLHQNYPNPFNPVTTIKIDVPVKGAEFNVNIYNVTGQLVKSFSGVATNGFEVVTWDASNVSSGVYFYKLTSGDFSATKKAVLLK